MKEGLSVTSLALAMALRRPSRSVLPSGTCWTCQPRASYRLLTSSVKEMEVSPSMEILLSSYRAISLPRPQWPAREEASLEMPSIMQPSPTITYLHAGPMVRNMAPRWEAL